MPHTLSLKMTPIRREVIALFKQNPGIAYSESEIDKFLVDNVDRTTIYRTIRVLLSEGFIHKVVCCNGVLKYALSCGAAVCSHAHFECVDCGQVSCLEDQHIQNPTLSDGYEARQANLLIQGLCPSCNEKQRES